MFPSHQELASPGTEAQPKGVICVTPARLATCSRRPSPAAPKEEQGAGVRSLANKEKSNIHSALDPIATAKSKN